MHTGNIFGITYQQSYTLDDHSVLTDDQPTVSHEEIFICSVLHTHVSDACR